MAKLPKLIEEREEAANIMVIRLKLTNDFENEILKRWNAQ